MAFDGVGEGGGAGGGLVVLDAGFGAFRCNGIKAEASLSLVTVTF